MSSWISQHLRALLWALRRLASAPVNTLLSLIAISVALALPAGGWLLLKNGVQIGKSGAATPELSLFLSADADRKAVDAIALRLKRHSALTDFRFVPREDTLTRFQAREGFAEVLSALPGNPFPDAYVARPREDTSADELEKLREEFSRWPKVEQVQLDSAWARRLDALLHLGRIGVGLLAALLALGLVAIIFTTIRLQVLTQRAEIEVSRLLGATDAFIARPFYYLGTLQGLLGGAGACLIVSASALALRAPLHELAGLYAAGAELQALTSADTGVLLAFATALGWAGAALSLGRHLREAST